MGIFTKANYMYALYKYFTQDINRYCSEVIYHLLVYRHELHLFYLFSLGCAAFGINVDSDASEMVQCLICCNLKDMSSVASPYTVTIIFSHTYLPFQQANIGVCISIGEAFFPFQLGKLFSSLEKEHSWRSHTGCATAAHICSAN